MKKGNVEKIQGGFTVKKTAEQTKRDQVKGKTSPTNKDIAELLEQVLQRLDNK